MQQIPTSPPNLLQPVVNQATRTSWFMLPIVSIVVSFLGLPYRILNINMVRPLNPKTLNPETLNPKTLNSRPSTLTALHF